MTNDTISDYLTRIRNAAVIRQDSVSMPASNMLVEISKILEQEGFIAGYEVVKTEPQDELVVSLRYVNDESVIRGLKRMSKPGRRMYTGYRDMKRYKGGMGVNVFSTPEGLMTGKQARKAKVGGEYLFNIY